MTKFTELKITPEAIEAKVEATQKALKANKGVSDLLGFGLGVIARRLSKEPQRYRDYGPYWWALKSILNANGYHYGEEQDQMVALEYCGLTETQTMVMADTFRTEFLETHAVGTVDFQLSQEGDPYTLHDPDMEAMAAA